MRFHIVKAVTIALIGASSEAPASATAKNEPRTIAGTFDNVVHT